MKVLVTGGCGYIGSHQVVALSAAGHEVCVVDDLSTSSAEALDRVAEITGKTTDFRQFSVCDTPRMLATLRDFEPEAMIHLAGLKHVAESTMRALDYHDTNVGGLLSVLDAASQCGLRKMVFSSSGSVYGETRQLPIVESHPHNPTNPYSASKSMCERILSDVCASDDSWSVVALRYFNPAGAHPSGLIGEDPLGPASNLVPALTRSATTEEPSAKVFGTDFETPDGSGVRDYVHVMDVAATHIRAIEKMTDGQGFSALNVGRGVGVSVREMVKAVAHASGRDIKMELLPRRPGDVSSLYCDTSAAREALGPMEYRDLSEICEDAWRWQSKLRGSPEA